MIPSFAARLVQPDTVFMRQKINKANESEVDGMNN